MSKRKSTEKLLSTESQIEGQIRVSTGHDRYSLYKTKYPTARRLRCTDCKKTWKFSDKLNYSICPVCKTGRLS